LPGGRELTILTRLEAGRGPVNVFFPQIHRPGAEAVVSVDDEPQQFQGDLGLRRLPT
jgi:hypothetical protein